MKFSTATGLMLALATTEAFAPSNMQRNGASQSTALFADESNNNFSLPKIDAKAAASFVAASVFAFSTVGVTTTALPGFVEPAHAASTVAKPEPKKLSKEEKEYKSAQANLELSKKTLKAYEKLNSDAKSADKKASSALDAATKSLASAKKAYTATADKLDAAKKQKMPTSAITELSADAGTKQQTTTGVASSITFVALYWIELCFISPI